MPTLISAAAVEYLYARGLGAGGPPVTPWEMVGAQGIVY
jgi:hypothetical protein